MKIIVNASILLISLSISLDISKCLDQSRLTNTGSLIKLCPPAHEESKNILVQLLHTEQGQENRKDFGIQKLAEDDIHILKGSTDKIACSEIQKRFPWRKAPDNVTRAYYKTNNFYFIVNYSSRPATKGGIMMSGHGVVILTKEFERLGTVLNF